MTIMSQAIPPNHVGYPSSNGCTWNSGQRCTNNPKNCLNPLCQDHYVLASPQLIHQNGNGGHSAYQTSHFAQGSLVKGDTTQLSNIGMQYYHNISNSNHRSSFPTQSMPNQSQPSTQRSNPPPSCMGGMPVTTSTPVYSHGTNQSRTDQIQHVSNPKVNCNPILQEQSLAEGLSGSSLKRPFPPSDEQENQFSKRRCAEYDAFLNRNQTSHQQQRISPSLLQENVKSHINPMQSVQGNNGFSTSQTNLLNAGNHYTSPWINSSSINACKNLNNVSLNHSQQFNNQQNYTGLSMNGQTFPSKISPHFQGPCPTISPNLSRTSPTFRNFSVNQRSPHFSDSGSNTFVNGAISPHVPGTSPNLPDISPRYRNFSSNTRSSSRSSNSSPHFSDGGSNMSISPHLPGASPNLPEISPRYRTMPGNQGVSPNLSNGISVTPQTSPNLGGAQTIPKHTPSAGNVSSTQQFSAFLTNSMKDLQTNLHNNTNSIVGSKVNGCPVASHNLRNILNIIHVFVWEHFPALRPKLKQMQEDGYICFPAPLCEKLRSVNINSRLSYILDFYVKNRYDICFKTNQYRCKLCTTIRQPVNSNLPASGQTLANIPPCDTHIPSNSTTLNTSNPTMLNTPTSTTLKTSSSTEASSHSALPPSSNEESSADLSSTFLSESRLKDNPFMPNDDLGKQQSPQIGENHSLSSDPRMQPPHLLKDNHTGPTDPRCQQLPRENHMSTDPRMQLSSQVKGSTFVHPIRQQPTQVKDKHLTITGEGVQKTAKYNGNIAQSQSQSKDSSCVLNHKEKQHPTELHALSLQGSNNPPNHIAHTTNNSTNQKMDNGRIQTNNSLASTSNSTNTNSLIRQYLSMGKSELGAKGKNDVKSTETPKQAVKTNSIVPVQKLGMCPTPAQENPNSNIKQTTITKWTTMLDQENKKDSKFSAVLSEMLNPVSTPLAAVTSIKDTAPDERSDSDMSCFQVKPPIGVHNQKSQNLMENSGHQWGMTLPFKSRISVAEIVPPLFSNVNSKAPSINPLPTQTVCPSMQQSDNLPTVQLSNPSFIQSVNPSSTASSNVPSHPSSTASSNVPSHPSSTASSNVPSHPSSTASSNVPSHPSNSAHCTTHSTEHSGKTDSLVKNEGITIADRFQPPTDVIVIGDSDEESDDIQEIPYTSPGSVETVNGGIEHFSDVDEIDSTNEWNTNLVEELMQSGVTFTTFTLEEDSENTHLSSKEFGAEVLLDLLDS